MSDRPESHRATARPRKSGHRYVLWGVLAVVALLVLAVAWVGVRGAMAKGDLERSAALVAILRTDIAEGKTTKAQSDAGELERRASSARSLTSDPVWQAFEVLPAVGPNLRAVRQVSAAVDEIASGAVRPAVGLLDDLDVDAFKPTGGKLDLRPLVEAQPVVARATDAIEEAQRQVEAIDTSVTVTPIANAVDELRGSITTVSTQAQSADRVVQLAPEMLGAGGPRHYLLLFQNNAELRAGGGIPGAVARLEVDDGAISLADQAAGSTFGPYEKSVLPLTTDTQGLYGAITGQYMQDVTLTPRFDTSARLASEMWRQRTGEGVDGVIALDPVTLGYILAATGPVTLPTGDTLTSENAVQLLLSEAYAKYPNPSVQDVFFAGAASSVFAKVSSGGFDPKAFVTALTRAVDENRIRLWSANAQEQRLISGTPVAGELPRSDASSQRFGVYLNDGTGAKMDYYLEKSVSVGSAVCRRDGRPTWVLDVTLRSTAPADAGASLPEYVTGGGDYGVPPGRIRTNVAIYAPSTGVYLGASQDGKTASPQTALDGKYPVTQFETTLSPGESTTLRVAFLGPVSAARTAVSAEGTPGVHADVTKPLRVSCENPIP